MITVPYSLDLNDFNSESNTNTSVAKKWIAPSSLWAPELATFYNKANSEGFTNRGIYLNETVEKPAALLEHLRRNIIMTSSSLYTEQDISINIKGFQAPVHIAIGQDSILITCGATNYKYLQAIAATTRSIIYFIRGLT